MLIGEVADAVGMTTQAIRFYERKGLLPDAERGANGYRVYDEALLTRLRFITVAQAAGLTLAEIRSIIDLRDKGSVPCGRSPRSWSPPRKSGRGCETPRRPAGRARSTARTQQPTRPRQLHRRRHMPHPLHLDLTPPDRSAHSSTRISSTPGVRAHRHVRETGRPPDG